MALDSAAQTRQESLTRHNVVPPTPRTEINITPLDPILEKVDFYLNGKDPKIKTAAEQAKFDAPKAPAVKDTRTFQEKIDFYTKGTNPIHKTN